MTRRLPLLLLLLAALGAVLLAIDSVGLLGGAADGGRGVGEDGALDPRILDRDAAAGDEAVRLAGSPEGERLREEAAAAAARRAAAAGAAAAAAVTPGYGVSAPLRISVVDDAGRPVAGAVVSMARTLRMGTSSTATDVELCTGPDGRVETSVGPGRWRVEARAPGTGAVVLPAYLVEGTTPRDLELQLQPTATLTVVVRREGRGLADVAVVLKPFARPAEEERTTTDGAGEALYAEVIAGRYALTALLPEGGRVERRLDVQDDRTIEIELEPGTRLHGRILGPQGELVSDARVHVDVHAANGLVITAEGRSTAAGAYEVFVPPGRIDVLKVEAAGYAPWPGGDLRAVRSSARALQPLRQGTEVEQDVRLERGLKLVGEVRDELGAGVPEVAVRFVGRRGDRLEATSDAEGGFTLEGLVPDRYDVVVLTEGWQPEGGAVRETVPASTPEDEPVRFLLVVLPTRTLTGVVLQADGTPAAGARAWSSGGRLAGAMAAAGRAAETFTDERGRFALHDLPSGQTVTVRAALGPLEARPRYVRTDQPPEGGVVLRLAPTVDLEGRVYDVVERSAVAGARVDLKPVGPPAGRTGTRTTTDAEGRFRAEDLIPGTWELVPSQTGYLVAEATRLELSESGGEVSVSLHLDPGLSLGGIVAAPDGRAVAGARVDVLGTTGAGASVRRGTRTDPRGAWRLTGFEAGTYRVVGRATGYRAGVVPEVHGGETRLVVTLRPPPGAR